MSNNKEYIPIPEVSLTRYNSHIIPSILALGYSNLFNPRIPLYVRGNPFDTGGSLGTLSLDRLSDIDYNNYIQKAFGSLSPSTDFNKALTDFRSRIPDITAPKPSGLDKLTSMVSKYAPAFEAGLSIANTAIDNASIKDTSSFEESLKRQGMSGLGYYDNKGVLQGMANHSYANSIGYDKIGKSAGEHLLGIGKATATGALTGAQFGGPLGAVIGGGVGLLASGIGSLFGISSAKDKERQLHRETDEANKRAYSNFAKTIQDIEEDNDMRLLKQYYGYKLGGYLR